MQLDLSSHGPVRAIAPGEAHRQDVVGELGWEAVEVVVLPERGPDVGRAPDGAFLAMMAEIAESLHRREVGTIERAELVASWVRLTEERKALRSKPAQPGPVSKRGIAEGLGNTGGARQAARELGVSRQSVERSVRIAGLSNEAKAAAKAMSVMARCRNLAVAR
jgi:hypothetical protein